MWVIRALALSLIIIPSKLPASFARDPFYGIPCANDEGCNDSITHLRCLRKGSKSASKICECQYQSKYDNNLQQCLATIDQACDVKIGPKCFTGTYCQQNQDMTGNYLSEGICTPCPSSQRSCQNMETVQNQENTEILTTTTPKPHLQTTTITTARNPLGISCTNEKICNPSKTYLKCLKISKESYKCSCSRTEIFDNNKKMCVLLIGASCSVPSDDLLSPQECVDHGTCVSLSGYGSEGRCCHIKYPKICQEFEETNTLLPEYSNKDYHGQNCQTESDCDDLNTHLRCLKSGAKKICHCGFDNFYSKTDKKCFLGIDQECIKPVYHNQNPQQCADHGICKFHEKSDKGTCTCKPNSKHVQCQGVKVEEERKDLYEKFCKNHDECQEKTTYLRCLPGGRNNQRICHCGFNNVYDQSQGKCFLGLGQQCHQKGHGKVENPQLCIAVAMCISKEYRKEALGVGTCVCRRGSGENCNEFNPLPGSVATMKSSSDSLIRQCFILNNLKILIIMSYFIL